MTRYKTADLYGLSKSMIQPKNIVIILRNFGKMS